MTYVDGLKQGEKVEYYRYSKNLKSKVNYVDDLMQGMRLEYFESGALKS